MCDITGDKRQSILHLGTEKRRERIGAGRGLGGGQGREGGGNLSEETITAFISLAGTDQSY